MDHSRFEWNARDGQFRRMCGVYGLVVGHCDSNGVTGGLLVGEIGLGGEVVTCGSGIEDGHWWGGVERSNVVADHVISAFIA